MIKRIFFATACAVLTSSVAFAQTAPAVPAAPTAPAVPAAPANPLQKRVTPPAPAAPAAAAPAPAAKAAAPAKEAKGAGAARRKQCSEEYQTAKKANTLAGQTWPKFYSACNTRLKAAGQ